MKLFEEDVEKNYLPYEGIVHYCPAIISINEAINYTNILFNEIAWKNDEAVIFGKHIITKRKVAWYGNEGLSYTYSNITKVALPWTENLLSLKKIVEEKAGVLFNACLLNLYHDGNEGMAWHSDDEKELIQNGCIASLSLGAERKFMLKHKERKDTISIVLENGSLLIMKDQTQTHWLHQLPKTTKVKTPRINLTFRIMKV